MNQQRLPRQFDFVQSAAHRKSPGDHRRELLRLLNLKVTPTRLLLLETIEELQQRHFSAQDLYDKVKQKNSEIGFATVWRFLKTLVQTGHVSETKVGNGPSRYEWTSPQHHDHLTCVVCGKIVEFYDEELEKLQEIIAQRFGFQLKSHLMELYGICPECQKALKLSDQS